jgi:dienelactone hydrolase
MRYLVISFFLFIFACTTEKGGDESTMAAKSIKGEQIVYSAEGVNLNGYLAYDEGSKEKRPGVLVVHEWWGHNEYARKRAQMLAEMGYVALAVDMYGEGKQAKHPDDAGKFASEVMQNVKMGEARFLAALEVLKKHDLTDAQRIAAIGYCFGGSVVLHMARVGTDLKGVVSFHGGLSSMHTPEPGSVIAKVLVCNGAADVMVKSEDIEAFKKEMEEAGADYEFVNYAGAMHSFTNPDANKFAEQFELPLAYNAQADQLSWEKMTNLFKEMFAQ